MWRVCRGIFSSYILRGGIYRGSLHEGVISTHYESCTIWCMDILDPYASLIAKHLDSRNARTFRFDITRTIEGTSYERAVCPGRSAKPADMLVGILIFDEPAGAVDLDIVVIDLHKHRSAKRPIHMGECIGDSLSHCLSGDLGHFFARSSILDDQPPSCVCENVALCSIYERENGTLYLLEVEHLGPSMALEYRHLETHVLRRAEKDSGSIGKFGSIHESEGFKDICGCLEL